MGKTALILVMALAVTGCSRLQDNAANPTNWFEGRSADTLEPEEGYGPTVVDNRPPVAFIADLTIEPTPGGIIVRATGLPPTQGYWDAGLVRLTPDDTETATLVYEFRARPPVSAKPPGTEPSRRIEAAVYLSAVALGDTRQITVQGAENSRSRSR